MQITVHALILTPFQHQGSAAPMTSIDFSSEKACNDTAAKWPMKTYGGASARFTAVCVPK